MNSWLLITPITFLVVLAIMLIVLRLLGLVSMSVKTVAGSGKGKAYACGEDVKPNRARTEYAQFFPFAFFFTIMHVVALMVATVPRGNPAVSVIAMMYIVIASIGLLILYRS